MQLNEHKRRMNKKSTKFLRKAHDCILLAVLADWYRFTVAFRGLQMRTQQILLRNVLGAIADTYRVKSQVCECFLDQLPLGLSRSVSRSLADSWLRLVEVHASSHASSPCLRPLLVLLSVSCVAHPIPLSSLLSPLSSLLSHLSSLPLSEGSSAGGGRVGGM